MKTSAPVVSTDVQTQSGELDEVIGRFLAARSFDDRNAAVERLIGIGSSAVNDALVKLRSPQPPEIVDLLVKYLAKWSPIDNMISIAFNRNVSWHLRSASTMVLSLYWTQADSQYGAQIGSVLSELAKKDWDPKVRFAAVEALGTTKMLSVEIERILQQVSEDDQSPSVKQAAKEALEDLVSS